MRASGADHGQGARRTSLSALDSCLRVTSACGKAGSIASRRADAVVAVDGRRIVEADAQFALVVVGLQRQHVEEALQRQQRERQPGQRTHQLMQQEPAFAPRVGFSAHRVEARVQRAQDLADARIERVRGLRGRRSGGV
jgi:hypothetical protein